MLSSQDFENKHSDMLKAARDGKPYVEDDWADIFSFRENDAKIGDVIRINLPPDHYRKFDIHGHPEAKVMLKISILAG